MLRQENDLKYVVIYCCTKYLISDLNKFMPL